MQANSLRPVYVGLLALAAGTGTLLRVVHLDSHRFHVDEALFASYGLAIASGVDPMLQGEAVDKPPLFFYLLAGAFSAFGQSEAAAAVPSIVASVGAIFLVYLLCRRFFGDPTALAAAALMALSPFNVAYSFTAFIDPTLVAFALLSAVLAERRWFFLAGLCAGLLPALKAQGILLLPLPGVMAVFALVAARARIAAWLGAAGLFATGAALPTIGVGWWSAARTGQKPFLDLAAEHNPLVLSDPATYGERLADWWTSSLQYLTGSPILNWLLLVGVPVLLAWDLAVLFRGRDSRRAAAFDWALTLYLAFFVGWHTYYANPAWDRYMLATVPIGLILLARVLMLPWRIWRALPSPALPGPRARGAFAIALVALFAIAAPAPVLGGLRSSFPLGWAGEGGPTSYIGIEDVAAYFKAEAGREAILFDYKTLSWHYKYYLFGLPYKVVWFDDKLIWSFQQQVLGGDAGQKKYLVLPDWVNDPATRALLAGDAVTMREAYRTFRPDGSVSFTVYRLEAK